jgi:hypothetical protein
MEIDDLSIEENKLNKIVIKILNEKPSVENDIILQEVYLKYKEIHKTYANLAKENIEALKRGLFIQWYSITEPNYLTGISEIDIESRFIILNEIENNIPNLEIELEWMLNYYGIWDFTFYNIENFPNLENYIKNVTDKYFPKTINRIEMNKRGIMGMYWNSLTVFKD